MRVTTAGEDGSIEVGIGAGRGSVGQALRSVITRAATRPSVRLGAAVRLVSFETAAQAEHWMLWSPAAFGVGAASYFGLSREPPLVPTLLLAGTLMLAAIWAGLRSTSRAAAIALALAAFAGAGFGESALKTRLVASPIISPDLHIAQFEGRVVDVASPNSDRRRLVIAPTRISRIAPADLPARIRVTVDSNSVYGPGQGVRATAILDPPPGPASPGSYDFARDAFFERLGGVGAVLGAVEPVDLGPAPGLVDRSVIAVNALRWQVAQRLGLEMAATPGLPPGAAGLVVTVATSHEGWLPANVEDDLRASGLAHMLAIAGLHTAAVSGFVFFALRGAVAGWPWLALRVCGKKVAALGGLAAVITYLVLSGAHPPAKRAAITAGTAFVAILFDRRAISLHSLAMAALLILLLQPEAITQPGFQMSFCATAALVALSERWPRRGHMIGGPWYLKLLQRGRDIVVGLSVVSLVAGAATAPFAIQHFNRVAVYGLFANLTADFVASAILMPALVSGVLLDVCGAPWAVRSIAFAVAGWASGAILAIGRAFAGAPSAVILASSASEVALVLSFGGIVFMCLWKGRLRWLGLPLAFAVSLWPRPPPPVAWIAADAGNAAVVIEHRVVALKPAKRLFATQSFAQHRGLTLADATAPDHDRLFDCDRSSCAPRPGADFGAAPRLAAWFSLRPARNGRVDALCRLGEVVLLNGVDHTPAACQGKLVLQGRDLAQHGATELYRGDTGWRLLGADDRRGRRPWTARSAG